MSDTEDLAALNDRLMAKNHALAEALSRAAPGPCSAHRMGPFSAAGTL